ncbi:MAG: two-component sensor histidine kinase [Pseudonocardiales bacterium]|nr:two-component sensor histidine kinase [Pseudonocardiales bacterium]
MIDRARVIRAWLRRYDGTSRRSVIALVVTALLAFAVVATGTSIVAVRIARKQALAEALRSAQVVGTTVFAPLLPAAMRGDRAAIDRLNDAVSIRNRDGSLVRVKVWKRDGTVVYSDDVAAIGAKFPLRADVAASIDQQQNTVDVSNLSDPENVTEKPLYHRLVEVYIPLTLGDGEKLAFEMYSTDARVKAAEAQLRAQLVPFALLALLSLVIAQLPVSVWLVRRVGRAQQERSRLLNRALTASGRERRNLARDLHDGVVQDLAGASYAMDALANTLPPDIGRRSHYLVEMVGGLLIKSVGSLRSLMIDIYPPDLTADGLHSAMDSLAGGLRAKTQIEVDVAVTLEHEPSPEVAATLYRCARECLANIAKHSRASHATLRLTGDASVVRLRISDDGIGLPATGTDRHAEGHIGLQLLRDAAADLGGAMRAHSGSAGGSTVELDLPIASADLVGRSR